MLEDLYLPPGSIAERQENSVRFDETRETMDSQFNEARLALTDNVREITRSKSQDIRRLDAG